jgi:hypothetical protein
VDVAVLSFAKLPCPSPGERLKGYKIIIAMGG